MLKLQIAVAVVLATGLARAQTAAPSSPATTAVAATPSSAAKKELAARVLTLMKPAVETLGQQLAQQPALQIQQRAAMALQGVATERREVLGREIEADLRKYLDETAPLVRDRAVKLGPTTIAPMLEDRFTEDELRQIIAMLESPLNRRFQQTFPEMQRALAEKLVAEMRSEVETRARALEQTVSKRLNPTAAAPAATPAAPKK